MGLARCYLLLQQVPSGQLPAFGHALSQPLLSMCHPALAIPPSEGVLAMRLSICLHGKGGLGPLCVQDVAAYLQGQAAQCTGRGLHVVQWATAAGALAAARVQRGHLPGALRLQGGGCVMHGALTTWVLRTAPAATAAACAVDHLPSEAELYARSVSTLGIIIHPVWCRDATVGPLEL